MPGPQPRSTTSPGEAASTRARRSRNGRPRSSAQVEVAVGVPGVRHAALRRQEMSRRQDTCARSRRAGRERSSGHGEVTPQERPDTGRTPVGLISITGGRSSLRPLPPLVFGDTRPRQVSRAVPIRDGTTSAPVHTGPGTLPPPEEEPHLEHHAQGRQDPGAAGRRLDRPGRLQHRRRRRRRPHVVGAGGADQGHHHHGGARAGVQRLQQRHQPGQRRQEHGRAEPGAHRLLGVRRGRLGRPDRGVRHVREDQRRPADRRVQDQPGRRVVRRRPDRLRRPDADLGRQLGQLRHR